MAQLISKLKSIQRKREIQFTKNTLFVNASASSIILCLFFSATGSSLMTSKSSQGITKTG